MSRKHPPGEIHYIEDPMQFLRILRTHNHLNQHLLCDIYMHNYNLENDQSFNKVSYMGDIQLRAFTSFTINQVKWKKSFDMFKENQANRPLVIRMEHYQSVDIYNRDHQGFLQLEGRKFEDTRMRR